MQLTLPPILLLLSSMATAIPVATEVGATGPKNPTRPTSPAGPTGPNDPSSPSIPQGYTGLSIYTFTNSTKNLRTDLLNGNPAPGTSINGW